MLRTTLLVGMLPLLLLQGMLVAQHAPAPVHVGAFLQQVHRPYTIAEGLPSAEVTDLALKGEKVLALTAAGAAVFAAEGWQALRTEEFPAAPAFLPQEHPALLALLGEAVEVRGMARQGEEMAVAAEAGLFLGKDGEWSLALPREGSVRWAPVDVRAAAYDVEGRLWFACPQGVGYRLSNQEWRLFTGQDGLPFNDFTCMATGKSGVWFGTTNGVIRYSPEGVWEFRQGRRWLLDNHARDIVVDAEGNAWIATAAGISCIAFQRTTLADKAAFFEAKIDRYHRRTRLGYVNPAMMSTPGDKRTAVATASDNDGHFGGLYLGAVSLGYAATGREDLREEAVQAFEALAFLSEVTSGGTHPAPKGFIARAVEPTSGPDPNKVLNADTDRIRRETRDKRWKIISPRWPVDETGEWYWKCDSSSDELDGHYFGFGIYYDRVCKTEEEKEAVRVVVRRISDHLLAHNYRLVDHDGQPTRWTYLAPEDLNQDPAWFVERGLNSMSLLTFLSVTHHITGEQKYRDAYLKLAHEHSYAMNLMTQPKFQFGPGSFGQGDDNMAFMNLYHLLRYETDPVLLNMYYQAMFRYWNIEKYERNPFFNFVYAACAEGKIYADHWREVDVSPHGPWLDESVETLKRYPLDLVEWPLSNAHRIDMVPLGDHTRMASGMDAPVGHRVDGKVFPIDEQHALYWGDDPWVLTSNAEGTRLNEGVSYLLAYYMGLVHGYIAD